MAQPEEPLLPAEPPPRTPRILFVLGGSALLAVGALVVVLLRRPAAPAETDSRATGADSSAVSPGPRTESGNRKTPPPSSAPDAEERAAEELFGAAQAFARAHPQEPETIAAKFLEVHHLHPTTAAGRKAEQRARDALSTVEQALERDFQNARRDAEALAATGHFLSAIQSLRETIKGPSKEPLARRLEREIATLENQSREAFNRAVQTAGTLTQKGAYDEAVTLFRHLRDGAILEVSTRCDEAIAQLSEAKAAFEDFSAKKEADEALAAFRDGPGTRALGHFRARRYEEGLKELDPGTGALKDLVSRERDAAQEARAFWEGFLKAVRARSVQELSFAPAVPKDPRTVGKLLRIGNDRLVLDTGEASAELPFDKVALDQVVAWTVGKTLPADDPATFVKAALFFFLDGRDDLARTYLATAREMGADIRQPERVFREGLLRSVSEKKQEPK